MLIDSMLAKEERGECVVHAHTRDLSEMRPLWEITFLPDRWQVEVKSGL
jgi:hypothetical protein